MENLLLIPCYFLKMKMIKKLNIIVIFKQYGKKITYKIIKMMCLFQHIFNFFKIL